MKWLRWMIVCHFGRDCAKLDARNLRGPWPPPENYGLVMRWECGGCGRIYEKKVDMSEIYTGPS